jgi:putative ABC transport system permease protein
LAFTLLISLFTGVLCGITPALRSSSVNLNEALKAGGQKSVAVRGQRFGSVLVVTEIALSIVLLVGAGLMVRSLIRLHSSPTGFEDDNLLHVEINPTYKRREDYNVRFMSNLYQQLINRVAKVPGVIAVAANSDSPFVGQRPWYRGSFSVAGQAAADQEQNPVVNYQAVSPDYFKVMQIPVLDGRVFTDRDTVRDDGARDVAIINQRLAKRMWPSGDAIGKRINCDDDGTHCAEIIGVVGDVKHNSVDDEFGYDLYYACYQSYSKQTHFIARTQGDPLSFAPAMKQAIWEIAPDTGVFNVTPVATLSANTIWQRRLSGWLLGSFSALSLLLAAAGVYGVMTYFVTQRTREFGIRLALGAQRSDVLRLVVRNGMLLALIGLAIGVAGALMLTRLMRALLFEVTPADPITFGVVALGLIAVALVACYIPALRATKVDPSIALRSE